MVFRTVKKYLVVKLNNCAILQPSKKQLDKAKKRGILRQTITFDVLPLPAVDGSKSDADAYRVVIESPRAASPTKPEYLDEENAHLYMCERLIAAIEQMKWRQVLAAAERERTLSSQQPLTATPSPVPPSKTSSGSGDASFLSPGDFPRDRAGSSGSILEETLSEPGGASMSEDAVMDHSLDTSGIGSMDRTHTSSEIHLASTPKYLSPEAIAYSLLAKYGATATPCYTDLKWLVSSADAQQDMLPLPSSAVHSAVVSPDEDSVLPRIPLVVQMHPPKKGKTDLRIKQSNRCGACAQLQTKREEQRRVVYCEYFGKYMCRTCHGSKTAVIPARVLQHWDFHPYPVCDIASKYLSDYWHKPMYNLDAINPALIRKVKLLATVKSARHRLRFIWDFIRTCRMAAEVITRDGRIAELFSALPEHLYTDISNYSMDDFACIRTGELCERLLSAERFSTTHIAACELCCAKGFICELCDDPTTVLFPFQTKTVHRCASCGTCFHRKCYSSVPTKQRTCPRCERMRERDRRAWEQRQAEEIQEGSESDYGSETEHRSMSPAVRRGAFRQKVMSGGGSETTA